MNCIAIPIFLSSSNLYNRASRPIYQLRITKLPNTRNYQATNDQTKKSMIHQLRIYEIFEHNKAAFHARFRDHAARIMRRHGFEVVGMWEARTDRRTEFLYVLAWPDEPTKRAAWARFMADEEWKEIKRVTSAQHGDLVGAQEDRLLVPTDYSPRLSASA